VELTDQHALLKFTSGVENLIFARAALSKGKYLQQIPRQGKHKSLLAYLMLYGRLV
jgi:hypothetical protein